MRICPVLCAALVGICLAGCSSDTGNDTHAQSHPYTERYVPQAEPAEAALVRWRIGSIDPRFGLTEEQVREAVERAEAIWEEAAGRDLFQYDEQNGIPISLVFDHRQQRRIEQREASRRLDAMRARMQELENAFQSAADALKERAAEFESSLSAYNRQVRDHNRAVAAWNRSGGAPPNIASELREESRRLRSLQNALESERARLKREEQDVELKRRRYNELVDEYNAVVEEYNRRFGRNWEEEAGRYEAVIGPTRSEEKITIYVVEDLEYLTLIVAHELGHALGIEHVDDENAIMYAYTQERNDDGSYTIEVTDSDLAALHAALQNR